MPDSLPTVLILGGGVAGLSAADYLNSCGVPVHLVEKLDYLGGKARNWACMATDKCRNCGACLSLELADKVTRQAGVTLHLESNLASLTRQHGGFKAVVAGKAAAEITVSAVLAATGMDLYNPAEQADLGYAGYSNVITTAELNALLQQDALGALLPDSKQPAIAFIQCVGSRNREKGRDYCSRVCCKTSVRQANKILHKIPEAAVTVFNIDLQATGKEFRSQAAAAASKVSFLQGTPAKILDTVVPDKLTVFHEDGLGSRAAHHFDLVVLAVGMQPSGNTGELAGMLGMETNARGFLDQEGTPRPDGIYTAGVAGGPAGILASMGQGKTTAHRIADALGYAPQKEKLPVAVFGGGNTAEQVATALARQGYPVAVIAADDDVFADTPSVTRYPASKLTRAAGTAGNYALRIETPSGPRTLRAAALVVAEPLALSPGAATTTAGPAAAPLTDFMDSWNRKAPLPENILFWLDHNGPERKEVVKSILALVPDLIDSGKKVTLLLEKMLVNYAGGQRHYDTIRGLGAKILRVTDQDQISLSRNGDKAVLEINEATLPGITVTAVCDLLVLPENRAVSPVGREISRLLRQRLDAEGFLQVANVRHRNVGSPRQGVYFAGSSHDEAQLEEEIGEISAALELIGAASLEKDHRPSIDTTDCVRCLTCFRLCPHCAIFMKDKKQPEIDPAACLGCSLCVVNCPAAAIKAPEVPPDKTARTLVFACERSAALAAQQVDLPEDIRLVPVACACSLDTPRILAPLLNGAERVLLAPCHDGNCRSVHGSAFTAAAVERLARETRIPAGRLGCVQIAANEPARLKKALTSTGPTTEVA